MSTSITRFKLIFFVPPLNLSQCKAAVFGAGAGKYGKYSEVCFTTPGVGQFRPGEGSSPAVGQVGQLEEAGEVRCEVLCHGEGTTRAAVAALKK